MSLTTPDKIRTLQRKLYCKAKVEPISASNAGAKRPRRVHLADRPQQRRRDELMANSGDRSLANIGWLYQHDAAAVS